VLVLAPHPDDETFGCGGTIRMLTEGGVAVDVAFLTRGELGVEAGNAVPADVRQQVAQTRSEEAQAACAVLGVRRLFFLDGRDTQLADQPQLVAAIHGLLVQETYERVFCPWPQDGHDDHRATFHLLRHALAGATPGLPQQFWLYEVWKPLPANTFVPIDHTLPAKRQAIEQYRSQLALLNYREGFLGLAAYRSLFCPASRYAEAFWVCQRDELMQLR
jgi:LmbE family N-acetylglucosaminyl deacetylase